MLVFLQAGTASNPGFVGWYKTDGTTRMGYMGWDPAYITLQLEAGAIFQVNSIAGTRVNFSGGYGIGFSGSTNGGSNNFVLCWNSPNAGVVNISIDGGAVVQGLQPVSDERMKLDIAPSTLDCLATVGQIPLHEYRWRDISDPTKYEEVVEARAGEPLKPVGFIAQRVHEVFPEGVIKGDDYTDHLGQVWNIETNTMLALLTGAIQQLAARLTALEAA